MQVKALGGIAILFIVTDGSRHSRVTFDQLAIRLGGIDRKTLYVQLLIRLLGYDNDSKFGVSFCNIRRHYEPTVGQTVFLFILPSCRQNY